MKTSALKFLAQELSPAVVKGIPAARLPELAAEIREFLISSVSRTGGHIGANLSTIELSIALHRVFASPRDRIVFDTGHQGYTHKILTGRRSAFDTLNTLTGMSRFVTRRESEHDVIDASHAGTAISLSTGMAFGLAREPGGGHVVAVVGDGSMVEGMCFEGLNYAATSNLRFVLLLNDNEMAIAKSIGGMRHLMTGESWIEQSRSFFSGLGFAYIPVADGHSIPDLLDALERAKALGIPVVVHAKTEKGRGLAFAATHPYKMHFSMPFDPESGSGASPTVTGRTFGLAAADELADVLSKRADVVVITPATPYASYLQALAEAYPDRVIDVGMAEQHAIGMACGAALQGMKPVVCIQTTFMQRAFDQLIHDVAYMNLPVTVLGVRSGFSGYDSPTHHGIYDIPYLRSIPNFTILYPYSPDHMRSVIARRMAQPTGPMMILHPYEVLLPEEEISVPAGANDDILSLEAGGDGNIICLSNTHLAARALRLRIHAETSLTFAVHCLGTIKPAPVDRLAAICASAPRVISIEESAMSGAIGALVAEVMADRKVKSELLRCGVPDMFVPAGSKAECRVAAGIDDAGLMRAVLEFWPELPGADRNRNVAR